MSIDRNDPLWAWPPTKVVANVHDDNVHRALTNFLDAYFGKTSNARFDSDKWHAALATINAVDLIDTPKIEFASEEDYTFFLLRWS